MSTQYLRVDPRLERGDDVYEALVEMHRDLDEEQSRLANARLILLLSNHIGDADVLDEAMRIARRGVTE
ncbi:hypothetical protein KBTX_00103 [wastewater metagenome]|uniref:DUF2783 domain-containing protein n=2 Tax=unclassified sequences TaxID=12908 RepID=A0A5B8R7E3_9ZZZZ|nr:MULTISPECIES: DUF2783 domain-containing protein [Arhodomonas]MCS4502714.1 DUF2783 domain-containing protein [Arhodomonas aquaeolei]QEA03803.1 hypothetical protein KBTEX_00103 [uncultured organism]